MGFINSKRRAALPLCALFLAAALLVGCTPAPSSLAPSSSVSAASSSVPATSQPLISSMPTPFADLVFDDFAVYLSGVRQLDLEAVTFYRFSFAQNAASYNLDPQYITTMRGLGLGQDVENAALLYAAVPVQVMGEGGEEAPQLYEDLAAYLDGEEVLPRYRALLPLYYVDGEQQYDLAAIDTALAENAYAPAHAIIRYTLSLTVENGILTDITLEKSDLTPFALGAIEVLSLLDTENYFIQATGLSLQPGGIGASFTIQNRTDEPLTLTPASAMVNGKAPRDMLPFSQPLPAGGYVDCLLLLPTDALRAADIYDITSVSLVFTFSSESGEARFDSEPLLFQAPAAQPEAEPPPEES